MKKKIKLVRYNNAKELEEITNEFIKDKNIIDIKLQTTLVVKEYNCDGVPIKGDLLDTMLIIYEE